MKDFFKQQYEYSNPITQEHLSELPQKTYTSGEEKQINDVVLWGFKVNFYATNNDGEELRLDLFCLCEREFPYYSELYTIIENPLTLRTLFDMPIFIKKGEEEKFNSMKNNHLQ